MLDKVVKRIEELAKAIENSAANHNALIGAMQEARHMYELMKSSEKTVEESAHTAEYIVSEVEAVV